MANFPLRNQIDRGGMVLTLIAGLQGVDGLVLAVDSRGTVGDPRGLTAINDSHVKLFQLTSHVGAAIAGSSELAAQLISEIRLNLTANPSFVFIDDVMNLTRNILRSRYADWFGAVPPDQRPGVIFMLAGFTVPPHQPKIYILASQVDFAPQLFARHALAGVPQYAIYLLNRLYSPDMTRQNLVSLAAYVISETATQDPKVGGPIRIAEMSPDTGYSEIGPEVIAEINARNDIQNKHLKEFFFGGR